MIRAARPAVAAVAVVLAVAIAAPAFADETDPPPDPGSTGSISEPPALEVGGQPNLDPQVPEGVPGPPDAWPAPPMGDATPQNAPPPTGMVLSPEWREAFHASILARYGSISAAAAAGEVDSASMEALASAPVVDARAQEIRRLAHALRRMVPRAWSSWTGPATSLWIM